MLAVLNLPLNTRTDPLLTMAPFLSKRLPEPHSPRHRQLLQLNFFIFKLFHLELLFSFSFTWSCSLFCNITLNGFEIEMTIPIIRLPQFAVIFPPNNPLLTQAPSTWNFSHFHVLNLTLHLCVAGCSSLRMLAVLNLPLNTRNDPLLTMAPFLFKRLPEFHSQRHRQLL